MKAKILALLVFVLFALPFAVMAQGDEPLPSPVEVPQAEPWMQEVAFASLLVTSLVAVAKLIPFKPLQDIPAPRLALFLNIAIWAGYRFLVEMGADTELFASYISNLGNIVNSLLLVAGTFFGAALTYHGAKATNMPLLGATKKVEEPKG